jgi:hypothetical protein
MLFLSLPSIFVLALGQFNMKGHALQAEYSLNLNLRLKALAMSTISVCV